MDNWIWHKLWVWTKRRYRGAENAKLKCFSVKGWNFGYINKEKTAIILDRHDQTKVRKFVKIKANASIYDGNLIYFAKRLSLTNPRIKSLRNLIVKQKYSYTHCGLFMLPNDVIELHHILDKDGNRTGEIHFVHGYCHDHIHSTN